MIPFAYQAHGITSPTLLRGGAPDLKADVQIEARQVSLFDLTEVLRVNHRQAVIGVQLGGERR